MKNETLLNYLMRLQKEGVINSSSISAGAYKEFLALGESRGFAVEEKAGRGKCLKISNARILELEIKRLTPKISELDAAVGRLRNLAVNQDTKAGETTLECSYYACKTVGEGVVVDVCDVSAVTKALGCFSIPVRDDSKGVSCNGELLLVENQLLLDELKWIPAGFNGVILYYAGNLSARLLNWIKNSSFASVSVFPDYDAVGISNYANLKAVLPDAKWFWMKDWKEKLSNLGNRDLWNKENQKTLFENLWANFLENGFPDAQLRGLMEEIRKQGKMLEQESVMM